MTPMLVRWQVPGTFKGMLEVFIDFDHDLQHDAAAEFTMGTRGWAAACRKRLSSLMVEAEPRYSLVARLNES